MTVRLPDFLKPTAWALTETHSYNAPAFTSRPDYEPIPEKTYTIADTAAVLVLVVNPDPDAADWHRAGWARQIINLSLSGQARPMRLRSRKLWLNQLCPMRLARVPDSSTIALSLPNYFREASIWIWRYTGAEEDLFEILEQLSDRPITDGGFGNGPDGSGSGQPGGISFDLFDGGIG